MKHSDFLTGIAALACGLLFAGCGDDFVDVDTARLEPTRIRGLETDFPVPSGTWPPNELIEIRFPATMNTPGLNGLNGEGTVIETKWSKLEKDIVYEVNKFRQNPVQWCQENGLPMLDGLSLEAEFYSGGPRTGNYNFPAQIVYPSSGLHKAALHQTARGVMAHSDASRVQCYVNYSGWGENVGTYSGMTGQASSSSASPAAKIVNEFIRDRNVSDKGHRINIANPAWDRIGVGCYKNIVVMQFGYGISDK
ncbi:MAG: hypothetical protein LBG74_00550 [Spirochaetaceae bacterium]|jgi:uncharacterized protein YkwD|nr:hypothetical protein [Spirochaetaceae bacterium]